MNKTVLDINFFPYKLFFIVFFISWFFIPMGMNSINLIENINSVDNPSSVQLFYGWNFPFVFSHFFYKPVLNVLLYTIYFIPVAAVFLTISLFVKRISKPATAGAENLWHQVSDFIGTRSVLPRL